MRPAVNVYRSADLRCVADFDARRSISGADSPGSFVPTLPSGAPAIASTRSAGIPAMGIDRLKTHTPP